MLILFWILENGILDSRIGSCNKAQAERGINKPSAFARYAMQVVFSIQKHAGKAVGGRLSVCQSMQEKLQVTDSGGCKVKGK